MDTVWTTVKVRRSTLADAAETLPEMSNAAIVQRALEQITAHLNRQADPTDRTPVQHVAPPAVYANQITVDEAITRCPVCNDSLDDERRCVDPDCTSHRVTP